jgi:DNA-binding transcriptional LysR family regulator
MDVDTRLLRYFAAVAAEGNLTRAAERLFVSQPALTKQIKRLESQLGVRLFTRSRAGMTLTPAGQALTTAIANGDGIALAPESAARYYARPGITYRPVTGVSPSQVGVAWPPASDTNPVVQDFVCCCLDNKQIS